MTKKKVEIIGKKPINTAKHVAKKYTGKRNPGHIANRMKRSEMYGKYLQQKRQQKKEIRLKREKEAEELGQPVEKKTPKTLDNTREIEPTMVNINDVEIQQDEMEDEFAKYLVHGESPKVLITTRPRPSQTLFYFIADLQRMIPNLYFYPRKSFSIKDICNFAANRDFTHLIILSEKSKVCNGMTISHIGGKDKIGPTAFFKLTNVVTGKNIPNHGKSTHHVPELNLHGFGTRLGHRIGRLLGSLFPNAELHGRQVITFHNQRDYIFVRQHRYIFKEKSIEQIKRENQIKLDTTTKPAKELSMDAKALNVRTKLQELGPRFTLKLRWLQDGTFDTQTGEYEFYHKRKEMDTTRRKFHL